MGRWMANQHIYKFSKYNISLSLTYQTFNLSFPAKKFEKNKNFNGKSGENSLPSAYQSIVSLCGGWQQQKQKKKKKKKN